MPRIHSQSASGVCPITAPPAPTPALLTTKLGGPPNQLHASLARTCTSWIDETSHLAASALPPWSVIASAVPCAARSSMSLQTTLPPRAASSTANAWPIPLPEPVTTALLSWLRFTLVSAWEESTTLYAIRQWHSCQWRTVQLAGATARAASALASSSCAASPSLPAAAAAWNAPNTSSETAPMRSSARSCATGPRCSIT